MYLLYEHVDGIKINGSVNMNEVAKLCETTYMNMNNYTYASLLTDVV